MKKLRLIVISLILIFASSFCCFATTYKENLKRSLDLEGFIGNVHEVNITILTETGNLGYGTPFDITGADVQFNAVSQDLGRRVANWDFYSSTGNMKITIVAAKMYYDNDPSITLDYIISFKYKYAKYENGVYSGDVTGYLKTNSTDTDGENLEIIDNEYPIISSANQPINFMFMKDVNPKEDQYPAGDYTANVTITFTGT